MEEVPLFSLQLVTDLSCVLAHQAGSKHDKCRGGRAGVGTRGSALVKRQNDVHSNNFVSCMLQAGMFVSEDERGSASGYREGCVVLCVGGDGCLRVRRCMGVDVCV